jgi:hypothetical protein
MREETKEQGCNRWGGSAKELVYGEGVEMTVNSQC